MIVRIPSEGQWEIHGEALDDLGRCDRELAEALDEADAAAFKAAMAEMAQGVRMHGRQLLTEELVGSDLILPPADATLEELMPLFSRIAALAT